MPRLTAATCSSSLLDDHGPENRAWSTRAYDFYDAGRGNAVVQRIAVTIGRPRRQAGSNWQSVHAEPRVPDIRAVSHLAWQGAVRDQHLGRPGYEVLIVYFRGMTNRTAREHRKPGTGRTHPVPDNGASSDSKGLCRSDDDASFIDSVRVDFIAEEGIGNVGSDSRLPHESIRRSRSITLTSGDPARIVDVRGAIVGTDVFRAVDDFGRGICVVPDGGQRLAAGYGEGGEVLLHDAGDHARVVDGECLADVERVQWIAGKQRSIHLDHARTQGPEEGSVFESAGITEHADDFTQVVDAHRVTESRRSRRA